MNVSKRVVSLLLMIVMILGCLSVGVAVSAAPALVAVSHSDRNKTIEVEAGSELTVSIVEDPCSALNARYKFSNVGLFSARSASKTVAGTTNNVEIDTMFNAWNADPVKISCNLNVVVNAAAAAGDKCVITFYDCLYGDQRGGQGGDEGYEMTVTVVVKAASAPPTTTSKAPTTTTKAPTPTKAPTKLDFTELNKEIAAGEGLVAEEHTADSWAAYDAALQAAIAARNAKTQRAIDEAAAALKTAREALVKVSVEDRDALKTLLEEVKKFLAEDKVNGSYNALVAAIAEAETAIANGSKEMLTAALAKLRAAFDAYKKSLEELKKTEIVEVEKVVEKEPEGPYCNIFLHTLWLILLIVSVILNVLFILYYYRRYQEENKKSEGSHEVPPADIFKED